MFSQILCSQFHDFSPTNLHFNRGSVICVHGLHDQRRNTWESQTHPTESWLDNAFSEATLEPPEVLFYNYDSSEDSGRCYTSSGVYQMAEELLHELLSRRTADYAVRCIW